MVPRNGAHEPDNIDDPRVKFTTEIETDLLEFLLDIYRLLHGDERLMGMFIPFERKENRERRRSVAHDSKSDGRCVII